MRGFLEREEHDFFAWLKKLTLARMSMTEADLIVSAKCGALEAARAGITCLGDSSSVAGATAPAVRAVGLRGFIYQESFGPDPALAQENLARLHDQIDTARRWETELVRIGVSPHAPYTVSATQLELISRLAIDHRLPLMMHAAESQAEQLFMSQGTGPFTEGLKKRGIEWKAPGISSIEYLARHGVLETRPLLAHCVTVDEEDLDRIHEARASIAHCPKSNARLGHGSAPFAKFVSHEVNVGLGSDSVISNNTCDILEEARFATLIARSRGFTGGEADNLIKAGDALFAATLGGARALGLEDQIGQLAKGAQADITVVRLDGSHQQPLNSPVDALIFSSSARDVVLTMVAGNEIYRDDEIKGINEDELRSEIKLIRKKLDALTSG